MKDVLLIKTSISCVNHSSNSSKFPPNSNTNTLLINPQTSHQNYFFSSNYFSKSGEEIELKKMNNLSDEFSDSLSNELKSESSIMDNFYRKECYSDTDAYRNQDYLELDENR